MLIPSIAGEQPKLCRSAHGKPSSRSLRSQGRHSDGNATAPPDSASVPVVFPGCYVFTTHSLRCSCAGRSYPSHSTSQLHKLMGASPTTRTRQFHAVSRWHRSRTGMNLPCAPKHLSTLAHSDGKRASRRSLATRAQSGLCKPICADCSAHKLRARCDIHRGCICAAGSCWISPGKPPPVAYVCGAMLIVRFDRDYSTEGRRLQLVTML